MRFLVRGLANGMQRSYANTPCLSRIRSPHQPRSSPAKPSTPTEPEELEELSSRAAAQYRKLAKRGPAITYAARNLACHSRSAKLQDEGDWDQLAQLISKNLEELSGYLAKWPNSASKTLGFHNHLFQRQLHFLRRGIERLG